MDPYPHRTMEDMGMGGMASDQMPGTKDMQMNGMTDNSMPEMKDMDISAMRDAAIDPLAANPRFSSLGHARRGSCRRHPG